MTEFMPQSFRAGGVQFVLLATLVVLLVPLRASSQVSNADHTGGMLHATPGRPSFDVASIHQSAPGGEFRFSGIEMRLGTFKASGLSVRDLIEFAYAVPDEKLLSGGPSWIRTERFDLTAKTSSAENAALNFLPPSKLHDQFRMRLQSLLKERFGLQVSFAKKQLPLFVLSVEKSGLKCKRMGTENAIAFDNPAGAPPPPPPETRHRLPTTAGGGKLDEVHWTSSGLPFPLIVAWVSQQAEVSARTVVDRTGLEGEFDCEITWTRDEADPAESSFFSAIREHMGLRLRSERGPVETLFVENIELPTAN